VIDRSPEVVSFAVDPDKNFIRMPTPLRRILVRCDSLFSYLCGEQWSKPVSPGAYCLIAPWCYVDIAFVEKIFDLPQ